jgi:hypothetical protein
LKIKEVNFGFFRYARSSQVNTQPVRLLTSRRFGIRVTGNADASSVCPKRVADGCIGAFSNTTKQSESSVTRVFPDGTPLLSVTRFSFYFNNITRFYFNRHATLTSLFSKT